MQGPCGCARGTPFKVGGDYFSSAFRPGRSLLHDFIRAADEGQLPYLGEELGLRRALSGSSELRGER